MVAAEVGEALQRLVDLADAKEEQCKLRVELARLNAERYQANDTAIDLLRVVLDDLVDEQQALDDVVALAEGRCAQFRKRLRCYYINRK